MRGLAGQHEAGGRPGHKGAEGRPSHKGAEDGPGHFDGGRSLRAYIHIYF